MLPFMILGFHYTIAVHPRERRAAFGPNSKSCLTTKDTKDTKDIKGHTFLHEISGNLTMALQRKQRRR